MKIHRTLSDYVASRPLEEQLIWLSPAQPFRVLIRQRFFQRMILYRYVIYPAPLAITAALLATAFALIVGK